MSGFPDRENQLFEIIETFSEHNLEFLVIGGYAVSAFQHRFSVDAASQTGEWATDIDTDGATENDPLPSLTHLYDVSIQLLIFDSADGTTAETVCEDVATVVKGVLPDGVETVDYRLARANASGVLGKSSRWRARRLVSRLRNRTVPVAGAYRLYGLKAHLGLHDRTAIPVTSRELWSYILLAGQSTARADRSQGSKPRDATVIPRPGEKQMAPLRWAQSWTTFVDGESSETGATGTGRDPADADTGTDHEMPSDSEKTVTTEPTGQQARTWRAWVTELVQSVWSVLRRSHESDRSSANMEDTDDPA